MDKQPFTFRVFNLTKVRVFGMLEEAGVYEKKKPRKHKQNTQTTPKKERGLNFNPPTFELTQMY